MAGSVTRQQQQVAPVPGTTINQGVGAVSGATTITTGTEIPHAFQADENNPDRKVSPLGTDSIGGAGTLAADSTLTGGAFGTLPTGTVQDTGGGGILGILGAILARAISGAFKVTVANTGAAQAIPVVANFRSAQTDSMAMRGITLAAAQNAIAVAASTSSVTILAANVNRNGVVLTNLGTGNLYLLLGSGPASTTVLAYRISPNTTWESPPWLNYTGQITGIWDAAGGGAYGQEF